MQIFLVGFMGCGKSTIGKALAHKAGIEFVDMDRSIVMEQQMTIEQIFKNLGEDAFRYFEHEKLLNIISTPQQNCIVATGGGLPCFNDNMSLIAEHSIYIKRSSDWLSDRLDACKSSRPLIKNKTKQELTDYINETMLTREDIYSKAMYSVDCRGLSDADIVDKISSFIF